ncbi:MAG: hypothetical protein LBU99_02570 [Spirochaetaceae bacterium]|jgi:hypothetical protein|nr:hypothetical protein [Spirochaetaceae bacterium]
MKKVMGMLVVTALLMGSVSAQKITMNYRTQAAIATITNSGADGAPTKVDFFNLDDNAYAAEAKDDLSITLSGDYAGASITIQPAIKGLTTGDKDGFTMLPDTYYGWVNYGSFKVTAGRFDSRYTGRVSSFAGNYSMSTVGEYVKLGGLKKAGMIVDAANLGTTGTAKKIHSLIADYTFNVGDADKLLVKLGFQETNIALSDDINWASTSLSLGYSLNPFGTIEGVFRWLEKDTYVLGAYLRPNKLVDNLDAVVGFTIGMDTANADNMATEMGIDVRAQYNISDAFYIATNMNFTKYTNDEWGMWIAGNGTYKVNELFTGKLTVSYIDESKAGDVKAINGLLGAEFYAMRNCSISSGVEVRYNLDGSSKKGLTAFIPLILRVKL